MIIVVWSAFQMLSLSLFLKVDDTQVSCSFSFHDYESGLASYKFQVYEKYDGLRRQIWPGNTIEWLMRFVR